VVVETAGRIGSYLHADHRKGALVEIDGGDEELGKDLAMHVTAIAPMVVAGSDVPADVVAKEREIFSAQAADSGKPPEIVEKMVEGRVRKFLAEVALVDQPFVKDPNTKIGQLLKEKGATCLGFHRLEVGEGIDKAEDDFAAEVAATVKGG
jgi:elongation factor Ts